MAEERGEKLRSEGRSREEVEKKELRSWEKGGVRSWEEKEWPWDSSGWFLFFLLCLILILIYL